jgi:hypothetical protein
MVLEDVEVKGSYREKNVDDKDQLIWSFGFDKLKN